MLVQLNKKMHTTKERGEIPALLLCRKGGYNVKKVVYTEEQIKQVMALLNDITVTGVQNAKRIAVIAQVLDSGTAEEKEGEE